MSAPFRNGPDSPLLPQAAAPRRPRFQFSLLGLMVLMLATAMFFAPVFYFMRGVIEGRADMKLIGMTSILAGPLLLTILVSILVTVAQWLGRK